jgi:hypothetical protein
MFQRWTGDWGRVKIYRARHGIYEQYEVAYLESNVDELPVRTHGGGEAPKLVLHGRWAAAPEPSSGSQTAARMASRTSRRAHPPVQDEGSRGKE